MGRLSSDPTDVPAGYALAAKNVKFIPGKVGSRAGHTAGFSPGGAVTSLYNWVNSGFSKLLYFKNGTTAVLRELSTGAEINPLFTQAAYGLSAAEMGKRIYIAAYHQSPFGKLKAMTGAKRILLAKEAKSAA